MDFEFKIYSTNKNVLKKIADEKSLDFRHLGDNIGNGYCSNGKSLLVFVKHSEVDGSESIPVISSLTK